MADVNKRCAKSRTELHIPHWWTDKPKGSQHWCDGKKRSHG